MVQTKNLKSKKVIIIAGPTAVGKSDFGVEVALRYIGNIISADSMQIYQKLNIGTGKITAEEMQGVKHCLLDIVPPDADFSVSDYVLKAKEAIDATIKENKLPIIVGGTGLYINALINGNNFGDAPKDDDIRNKFKQLLEQEGKESLYSQLKEKDPKSAEKININDVKRVIRALEIFEITGKPKSDIVTQTPQSEYDYKMFVLYDDKEILYERINNRVLKMFDNGLLDEVGKLLNYSKCQSMQAIGYKDTVEYLTKQTIQYPELIYLVQRNSRRYAKRQMTYFKNVNLDKTFVKTNDKEEILNAIKDFIVL